MNKYLPDNPRQISFMLLLAVAGSLIVFLWQGHQGFSLWDEGYLWYGAQRVMVGEVPIRDFMAYDIGRYYWSAAFMSLLDDNGIVALRVAIAIFQALALFIGLTMLARSSTKSCFYFGVLAAITLLIWMAPQYRVFDISLPIMLVGALAFLVEHPSRHRYFLCGLTIGLAAVFGRNHGLYGAAGSLGVMIYLGARQESGPRPLAAFTSWAAGVVAGYLPVLIFLLAVPGFAQAFGDSILVLFEAKATNFPLPIPWPWLVPFGKLPVIEMLQGLMKGILFIAIVVFGAVGLIWLIHKKRQNKPVYPMLVATIFLALPYAHYAWSRADLSHLAPGIPPFLLGILALLVNLPARVKWPLAALLCAVSLLIMFPRHAGMYCTLSKQCVEINVGRDKLNVDAVTASNLVALNQLAEQYAPGDRTFSAAPFWPGAYATLGRKSPTWEIFINFPRNTAFQQAEVERIKLSNPGFAIINDTALDGREDLRYANSHPVIDQYIREHFVVLNDTSRSAFRVYKSK